ncbi:MAG TPA: hypothetical protein VNT26_13545 [Candidatus Sulfotelmatobacter sp.]|nr:hypothetical protein [Candidatus Sulfotelmatobacter sp.]
MHNYIEHHVQNGQVECQTAEGQTREEHYVESSGPFGAFGEKSEKEVHFIIPPGFRRTTFARTIAPHGLHGGGDVDWVSPDPHDGRIRMYVWCDGFSSCECIVWDVMAIKETAP